jgi:hypothetical protein
MALLSQVCPKTTQQVDKNLIPWRQDKLSEPELDDLSDKIFRPLLRAEKQCRTLTALLPVMATPRYVRQESCKVAIRTANPMTLNVTLYAK